MQTVSEADEYEVWNMGSRVYEEVMSWWLDDTRPIDERDNETYPVTNAITFTTITAGSITAGTITITPTRIMTLPSGTVVSIDPAVGKAVPYNGDPNVKPIGIVMEEPKPGRISERFLNLLGRLV